MAKQRELIGTVLSDKMLKTRVVRVVRKDKDSKYGRIVKHYQKFKIHDENNISKVGDEVRIEVTRPLSKDKYFRLAAVLKKADNADLEIKDEAK